MASTYKGKSTAPGGGGAFARFADTLEAEGKPEVDAQAIAASAGRKKYGDAQFEDMAEKGKARAAAKKGPAKSFGDIAKMA